MSNHAAARDRNADYTGRDGSQAQQPR